MDDCIFCTIARHEIPKEFTYEDEQVMVFPDTHPVKPVHLLIVPKKHFTDFLSFEDDMLWNKIRDITQNMIRQFNLVDSGFRISANGGGAQKIDHFHLHLMGPMGNAI